MNETEPSDSSSLQQQVEGLKSINTELVRTVQNLKITAREREYERLDLLKELNHLRVKLCRLQSGCTSQMQTLEQVLRPTVEEAVTHMAQASEAVMKLFIVIKDYMKNNHELLTKSPRWSNLSSPRTCEKMKSKVRPMSYGGKNIQPFVTLNRVNVNSSTQARSAPSSRNRERTTTERTALPIHLLQDLYIPLMRIDATGFLQNNEETAEGDSSEELGLNDEDNAMDESLNNIIEEEEQGLNEIVEEEETSFVDKSTTEPLAGPSWSLDTSSAPSFTQMNEPDSTTINCSAADTLNDTNKLPSHVFTPTVRRRKRTSSPPIASPPALASKFSLRLGRKCSGAMPTRSSVIGLDSAEDTGGSGEPEPLTPDEIYAIPIKGNSSTPKVELEKEAEETIKPNTRISRSRTSVRARKVSASKKSVAESDVSVSETQSIRESTQCSNTEESRSSRSLNESTDSTESKQSQGEESGKPSRTRRQRKQVTYKEKPLNRKMRR